MTDKRVQIRGTDMTLAEELHFIHGHIESIEEEMKALALAMQAIVTMINQIYDAINEEAREPDG